MNDSFVNILDLPDEILIIIFKKLNNLDLLSSLVGVNQKLDSLVCDINFTRAIDLTTITSDEMDDSRTNAILDRFCIQILPRIQSYITCLTIPACFSKRVLYVTNCLNLSKLTLVNLEFIMALHIFNENSPFIYSYKHQISDLVVTFKDQVQNKSMQVLLSEIYRRIFALLSNLKYLDLDVIGFSSFTPSWLSGFPSTTCFSSSIVHLRIKLHNFDDLLCLLDGRLSQLHTFIVNLNYIHHVFSFSANELATNIRHGLSKITNSAHTLRKLKCFSLYARFITTEFENLVIPLLQQMLNLEKLTLSIRVDKKTSFIDGIYLHNNILCKLPHLHTVICDIITPHTTIDEQLRPSSDHIRGMLIERGYNVDCYVDYLRKTSDLSLLRVLVTLQ